MNYSNNVFGLTRIKIFFLLTLILLPLNSAANNDRPKEFNIPSQALYSALIGFAKTCGFTLVVSQDLIENKQSKALKGSFKPSEALKILLLNTQLTASISDTNQIKIFAQEIEESYIDNESIDLTEEMIVKGLYGSLQSSLAIKKSAIEIIEVVTEEDIGKMPDQNIAEILQRVPGVQLERRQGVGSVIRIRGLSNNVVTFNGDVLLTGLENLRVDRRSFEGSLEGTPIDFINQVKVYKTPSATQVEGGIGGVIDLTTRSGFDSNGRLITSEISAEKGEHQSKASPSAYVLYSDSWDDTFAINVSYSVNNSSRFVDSTILSNSTFYVDVLEGGEYFYRPLAPAVQTNKNDRTQTSFNLRFDYKPFENTELTLEWFANEMDYDQATYSIGVSPAFEPRDIDLYESDSEIRILRRGLFGVDSASVITRGTTEKISAENFVLSLETKFSDSFKVKTRLQSSDSDGTMRLGLANSEFSTSFGQSRTWVGLGGASSTYTGWVYEPLPRYETDMLILNGQNANLQFTNVDSIQTADSHNISNAEARGSNTSQSLKIAKLDIEWLPTGVENFKLNAGIRYAKETADYDSLSYLVDYSQTRNVAHPNSVSLTGEIMNDSLFDPSIAPQTLGSAISVPVFYDLCGNGGIPVGMECDIDGDGLDDNIGIGPYASGTSKFLPESVFELTTSSGQSFFELLYNTPLGSSGGSPSTVYPAISPVLTYATSPHIFTRVNNVFPSGIYHQSFIAPHVGPILNSPGEWLQSLVPLSPISLEQSPTKSWGADKRNLALYLSTLIQKENGFEADLGVRVVEAETEILTAIVPEEIEAYRLSLDLGDKSFPLIYQSLAIKKIKRDTFVLPSANVKHSFNESLALRLNAAKTIASPSGYDLGHGDIWLSSQFSTRPEDLFTDSFSGNSNLSHFETWQYDIAWDVYWGQGSSFTLNLFKKDLPTYVLLVKTEIDDEFYQERPVNLSVESITGAEVSTQYLHSSGLGLLFNYTFIDSEYPDEYDLLEQPPGLPGISRHLYNVIGFYENEHLSLRLAYSAQSEYLAPYISDWGFLNFTDYDPGTPDGEITYAEIYRPYDQLDARITWNYSDALSMSLDLINITQSSESSYLGDRKNTAQRIVNEPNIAASIKYSF